MTSTTNNIGLSDTERISSSIMKPPGGDCHDLFGADFRGCPAHHRVLKPPGGGTSDIFTSPVDETDKRMTSPVHENGQNSNGLEKTGNDIDKVPNSTNQSGEGNPNDPEEKKQDEKPAFVPASSIARNCVTGEGCQTQEHYAIRVVPQKEGNPVTGEGYDDPKTQQSAPVPLRTRIPPGGYSSGLW